MHIYIYEVTYRYFDSHPACYCWLFFCSVAVTWWIVKLTSLPQEAHRNSMTHMISGKNATLCESAERNRAPTIHVCFCIHIYSIWIMYLYLVTSLVYTCRVMHYSLKCKDYYNHNKSDQCSAEKTFFFFYNELLASYHSNLFQSLSKNARRTNFFSLIFMKSFIYCEKVRCK